MEKEDPPSRKVSSVGQAKDLINSLLKTAEIDVALIDLSISKEIIVAAPEIINYAHELELIDNRDGIELGARYLAAATINTEGRQVQTYVRFYLMPDGSLTIEDSIPDSATVTTAEEAETPELWRSALEACERWGPNIVQLLIMVLTKTQFTTQ